MKVQEFVEIRTKRRLLQQIFGECTYLIRSIPIINIVKTVQDITDPHQTIMELDWDGRRRLFDNYKNKATSIEFK